MPKLIVVSNRLPVSLSTTGELTRSSGGLVSALSSLSTPFLWVGSLGSGGGVDEAAKASLAASGCLAVEMPEKVYEAYYVRVAQRTVGLPPHLPHLPHLAATHSPPAALRQ